MKFEISVEVRRYADAKELVDRREEIR